MGLYASETKVPAERSKAEIETTVRRYGAEQFGAGWKHGQAIVAFAMKGRQIRFILPLPDEKEFTAVRSYEQAVRQRWRALALAIKAKLECVESGITTFEEEFLAHIVMPNGHTAGEWLVPQIAEAYEKKKMPPLLLGAG